MFFLIIFALADNYLEAKISSILDMVSFFDTQFGLIQGVFWSLLKRVRERAPDRPQTADTYPLSTFNLLKCPSVIFLLSAPLLSRLPLEVAAAAHAAGGEDQGGQNPTSYQGAGKPEKKYFQKSFYDGHLILKEYVSVLMIPDELLQKISL